jgi:hypothetical protein
LTRGETGPVGPRRTAAAHGPPLCQIFERGGLKCACRPRDLGGNSCSCFAPPEPCAIPKHGMIHLIHAASPPSRGSRSPAIIRGRTGDRLSIRPTPGPTKAGHPAVRGIGPDDTAGSLYFDKISPARVSGAGRGRRSRRFRSRDREHPR